MGPWSGLRMVLDREKRELAMPNSLDGSIVQVDVRHLERWRAGDAATLAKHREAMVLRGDEDLVIAQVANRVVSTAMTIRQFCGSAAVGEPYQLVPEADAERREPGIRQLADRSQCVAHRRRIAGAVGKEEAVGI